MHEAGRVKNVNYLASVKAQLLATHISVSSNALAKVYISHSQEGCSNAQSRLSSHSN